MDKGGGEGERNGKSSMDACTVIYVNRQPVGNLLYNSGNSNWGSVITEGWEWVGSGREIQEGGDICTPMVNSC